MKRFVQLKIFKTNIPFILIFILIIALSLESCKGFGVPDWKLTVTFEEGVDGTPAAGEYIHQELDVIEYNYYPVDDAQTVEVMVNDSRWIAAGEFVIYSDLNVLVRLFDIRFDWIFSYKEDDSNEETEITLTFTGGGLLSGEFTDDRGYSGNWEINDGFLTVTYSDWKDYIFTGVVPSMSGDWTGEGKEGTWKASKQ